MWELDRTPSPTPSLSLPPSRASIVGRGRLGTLLAAGLRSVGVEVDGPLRRGDKVALQDGPVLLCVPDAEIASAAALVPAGALAGHCSGATTLDVLAPREAFSMHPLMTVATGDDPERLRGAGAAVAGSTARALAVAEGLARALGMRVVQIADEDRAAYHAAASIASNFLITLEAAAERVLATAGADRDLLVPLVRATVENWARLGPERALTGPVARGDEATVARQRAAIAERTPDLLGLFDQLVSATRAVARAQVPA
jgi:predicted short-subunit dehydrogenase-like oxidoreductase (DUF2520 family)